MKFLKFLVITALFGCLAIGGIAYWMDSSLKAENVHSKAGEFITIEKGTSPNQIIAKLTSEGVLKNPVFAQVYLRLFGDASKLKAGDYQFKSPISALEVLKELESGKERTRKITIPEGWTRFEISKRIAETFPTEPAMDDKAVLELMNDTSLIRDFDPDAKNLEGYLFPTTYEFPLDATPKDVIKRMVEQFRKTWKPEWTLDASKVGKTPRQIVTIASLIENESKFDAERRIVSSVIYNRLDRGMALGIDATNVYIAKLLGKWDGIIHKSDIDVVHPYNTRKISGLPPGPISSASESALEAALSPDKTDYLYYVLNVEKNDGSHHFYASAAEFERGKAAYQKWLAEQRQKKSE
ncbi:MAG: endolytic transglycosylase MltG [Acidobacteria bacterium]|nr:endolytic transglycosylase MltG [Acidobacteriota bacterium]